MSETDKKEIGILIDNLLDTRYLFEIIGVALQAYEDIQDDEKMYYLNGTYKIAMQKLRVIEDALNNAKP